MREEADRRTKIVPFPERCEASGCRRPAALGHYCFDHFVAVVERDRRRARTVAERRACDEVLAAVALVRRCS